MKKLITIGLATLLVSFSGKNIESASFYADKYHGRTAADGSKFSQTKMTAASNQHPLGTKIRVTNTVNNKSVDVKVTDRLHKKYSHRVDLSKSAFMAIAPLSQGIAKVRVEKL